MLEEQGYLSHPHTSAGRIPTDRGYRFYVDALSGVGELARAQEETIARFFEGAADLEETLQRTSLLLSSLTHYTAMVAPPALDRSRLRHIEVVGLGRHVIMLVLIVDSGRVEKRLVETAEEISVEDLEALRRQLNERLANERLSRAELVLDAMAGEVRPSAGACSRPWPPPSASSSATRPASGSGWAARPTSPGRGPSTGSRPSAGSTRRWSSRCWCCACSRPPWAATSGCRW